MNIFEALKKGDNILKKSGIKSYKLDSEILMSKVFQKNRIDIILNSKPLSKPFKNSLKSFTLSFFIIINVLNFRDYLSIVYYFTLFQ